MIADVEFAARGHIDRRSTTGFLSECFHGLAAIAEMPSDSLGDRPWRRCELTFENTGAFRPRRPRQGG